MANLDLNQLHQLMVQYCLHKLHHNPYQATLTNLLPTKPAAPVINIFLLIILFKMCLISWKANLDFLEYKNLCY